MELEEKSIISSLKIIESKKKFLISKKKRLIKEINSVKIKEDELKKKLKIIKKSSKLIVSIGFDKRWSAYNCIIKFESFHFSIYLGKEKKIKEILQQFYSEDISGRKLIIIKDEVKKIVSTIIPNYLRKFKSKENLTFSKIIELYISSGEWSYWKETFKK